jgi:hypothetical protein
MSRSRFRSFAIFILALASAAVALGAELEDSAAFEVDLELAELAGSGLARPSAARRVAVVGPNGTVEHFLAGEVVLVAPERAELDRFVERYAAEVLVGPDLPPPPPGHPAERVREVAARPVYRLAVDPRRLKLPDVDGLATEAGWRGAFRVSSEGGLELLALLFDAQLDGFVVAPNFLMTPQISEEHPHPARPSYLDADDPCTATTPPGTPWCMDHEGVVADVMRHGAARRYVELLEPQYRPLVAIVDDGFAVEPYYQPPRGYGRPTFGIVDLPPNSPMYDFRDEDYDAGGSGCLSLAESGLDLATYVETFERERAVCWHGTGSALVAAAMGNNRYGTVGTGASAAQTMFFAVEGDFASWARAIETAAHWGADVINTSLAMSCGFCCNQFDDAVFYALVNDAPIVASAGNVEEDNDHQEVLPCELDFAICVGGLSPRGFTAARSPDWGVGGGSNYGEDVDLWAKGDYLVAPLPLVDASGGFVANTRVGTGALDPWGGTSASAPFVAGVIALMKAIDPGLRLRQIEDTLRRTANRTSTDWRVNEGWGAVDAFAAVFDIARERRAGRLIAPMAGGNHWSPVRLSVELCEGCTADLVRYYARFDAGDGGGVRDRRIASRGLSGGVLRDHAQSSSFDVDWDVSTVPPQADVPVWAVISGPTRPVRNDSGTFIYGQSGRTAERPIDVRVDRVPPTGRIVEPVAQSRHSDTLPLRAEVEDDHELGSVLFKVGLEAGGYLPQLLSAEAATDFATTADVSALAEQRLLIEARVYDAQDNFTDLEPVVAFVDRSGPQIEVVYPSPLSASPTWITSTGSTMVRVQASDPAGIAGVEVVAWYAMPRVSTASTPSAATRRRTHRGSTRSSGRCRRSPITWCATRAPSSDRRRSSRHEPSTAPATRAGPRASSSDSIASHRRSRSRSR